MFCFRCKLIFEKKKEDQSPKAYKAHKAHKLTLSSPSRITLDHSTKSLNEIHGNLVWQLTVDCNGPCRIRILSIWNKMESLHFMV